MKWCPSIAKLATVTLLAASCLPIAAAQEASNQRHVVNSGTVGIMSGALGGTDLRIAADLANAFDDGYELRVLAVVGKGSVRDIEDLAYLRGIDIAIVQSDVLDFYKKHDLIKNIDQHVHYIAKLYDEEVHLLARREVTSVKDLAGKRVNFGPSDGGTYMTSSILFDRFDVEVDVAEYNHIEALQKLKSGEIDAMVMIEGKPVDLFETLAPEDGLHLVPLAAESVGGSYYSVPLSSADYPGLIVEGTIETIGIGEVLAAYNWPDGHAREVKLTRFVDQLFKDFDKLQGEPYHPKWQDVDLRADLPGWQRLQSARKWLNGS